MINRHKFTYVHDVTGTANLIDSNLKFSCRIQNEVDVGKMKWLLMYYEGKKFWA